MAIFDILFDIKSGKECLVGPVVFPETKATYLLGKIRYFLKHTMPQDRQFLLRL